MTDAEMEQAVRAFLDQTDTDCSFRFLLDEETVTLLAAGIVHPVLRAQSMAMLDFDSFCQRNAQKPLAAPRKRKAS